MPGTATGPLGTLALISSEVVDPNGTGERYLELTYSHDTTGATEPLVGFNYWHDNGAGSIVPVWVDAVSATDVVGDGGSPLQIYKVLIPVPLPSIHGPVWHESFAQYPAGSITFDLDKGGSKWAGPAVISADGT